jgi:hypothetical protein
LILVERKSKTKPKSRPRPETAEAAAADKELNALRNRIRQSKRRHNAWISMQNAAGVDFETRRRESRKRAAELGLSERDYGELKYAYLKAELSAKPNETLEQTRARAKEIWKQEVQKHRKKERYFMKAIMSLPEKEKRQLMNKMRSSSF